MTDDVLQHAKVLAIIVEKVYNLLILKGRRDLHSLLAVKPIILTRQLGPAPGVGHYIRYICHDVQAMVVIMILLTADVSHARFV